MSELPAIRVRGGSRVRRLLWAALTTAAVAAASLWAWRLHNRPSVNTLVARTRAGAQELRRSWRGEPIEETSPPSVPQNLSMPKIPRRARGRKNKGPAEIRPNLFSPILQPAAPPLPSEADWPDPIYLIGILGIAVFFGIMAYVMVGVSGGKSKNLS